MVIKQIIIALFFIIRKKLYLCSTNIKKKGDRNDNRATKCVAFKRGKYHIISDEDMVKDVIGYIRRLRRNRTKKAAQEETISKEEILAGIDAGLKDVLAGRTRPARELLNEL